LPNLAAGLVVRHRQCRPVPGRSRRPPRCSRCSPA